MLKIAIAVFLMWVLLGKMVFGLYFAYLEIFCYKDGFRLWIKNHLKSIYRSFCAAIGWPESLYQCLKLHNEKTKKS